MKSASTALTDLLNAARASPDATLAFAECFTFARSLGGFLEPVGWVTSVSQVTVAGVAQPAGWSLSTPNSLVFNAAPAAGALIGASFSYAFQCRFDADSANFEQFLQNLWRVESLKFRSVRTS